MSVRDKWVRRFSIDETAKHKNGFTIYKITSVLFPLQSPEAVTVISVWKRYSDVQQLHKSMKSLHAGLHLRGTFPALAKSSYFKRFHQEVIDERAKTIKTLLEFVAEHRLLFTSTDFVNFLQTGYPEPEAKPSGVINAIRSSLHLPIEETPPLEYQTDDDDARSPSVQLTTPENMNPSTSNVQTDIDISQIPIYEAAEVEIRESPKKTQKLSSSNSFESINSIDSLDSDLFDELSKVTIDKSFPSVKRNVLPDLINFDVPSTSKFEDYHTMKTDSDNISLNSTVYDCDRTSSRMSTSSRSVLSLSNVECKTRTEDSYVFEAGYLLNLAARCEDMGDYQRAFDCYKSGIEKMLIGVQTDTDQHRRALIREKTNKYLSYAEAIYKNHLCDVPPSLLQEREVCSPHRVHGIPLSMLSAPYEELSLYRVLAIIADTMMLVLYEGDQTCYAMKVIQKIPNNLTEFDDVFNQRKNETKKPILPTSIPYMVPLHAFIETDNLIFLILRYAPGEKLFDYIKNYAKSIPNTPARELNLENVFSEPQNKNIDIQNDNIDVTDSVSRNIDLIDNLKEVNDNIVDSNIDMSINELVKNSQELLQNVNKALSEVPQISDVTQDSFVSKGKEIRGGSKIEKAGFTRLLQNRKDVIPPSTICKWGAELLTALESLHNCGIIIRDLNPSNILLGDRGQIIMTYMVGYSDATTKVHKPTDLHVAPELHTYVCEVVAPVDCACDYWSYGVIMYQLICGFPLSRHHNTVFTSHTILELPDGLAVEAHSLLTQLLTFDPSERLGSGKDGILEIKQHPYFKHIDWQQVYDSWIVPD